MVGGDRCYLTQNMANEKTPEKKDSSGKPEAYRRPFYSENYKRKYDDLFAKTARKEGTSTNPPKPKKLDDFKRESLRAVNEPNRDGTIASRKVKRIEKIIIVIVYIVVLGIAAYFLLASFFPNALPFSKNLYEIKAGDSKLFNNLNSFYIDDPSVLGDTKVVNSITVRPITSSKKFNFVFAPKENIPSGKNATFYVDMVLNQSTPSDIYVDENLVFPNLKDYSFVKETSSDYIYVNNEVLASTDENKFQDFSSTEDFIYRNLPSTTVWSTRQLGSPDVSVSGYSKTPTDIYTTFRGDLKLAVYADGDLNIDFYKQDLNSYLGEDIYNVTVTDSSGNVVYTNLFRDDGDKTKSGRLGNSQDLNIHAQNLKSGVYFINFDDISEGSDTTLKSIRINSNKILILGNFLPIEPFNFYTEANSPKQIGFNYWLNGKDQVIKVIGTKNENINLSTDLLNKRYDENFTTGEYNFRLGKGYLWVYNDFSSPSKENWFDIPFNLQDKFNNQNVIIIDKYKYDNDIGLFSYSKSIDITKIPVRISLRALETNSAGIKGARFNIK
ncbi:Uncharacterised protein [uncultured archaeon]|nr:Uncharacterised protein [uncultured archaeon]